ncbi:MAG: class I SAM-dependent methyltransferase [Oceanicaulis sp.]
MALSYDKIGVDYARLRRPDPRIAARVRAALGEARTVVNVGAGAGSYEPADRTVVAVEPSARMIAQRPRDAAPAVRAAASALPFADGAFGASLAILTVHHWQDKAAGLSELRRVARDRVVVLTFDPDCRAAWLLDYLPELAELDAGQMPQMSAYEAALGPVEITPVPIPHDCLDGFLYAYWRRPQAYLDPRIRKGSSSFWALGERAVPGLKRLEADLGSGAWAKRYAALTGLAEIDAGYRLVVAR